MSETWDSEEVAWGKWYATSELKATLDALPDGEVDTLLKRLLLTKVAGEAFSAGWNAGWAEAIKRVQQDLASQKTQRLLMGEEPVDWAKARVEELPEGYSRLGESEVYANADDIPARATEPMEVYEGPK